MRFLSLGAGVQSSVMLMLALRGEIEQPDHVIFADTGFEPPGVYDHLKFLRKQCEKKNVPFHIVSGGNIRDDMVKERTFCEGREKRGRWPRMPLFVKGDGIDGMIRRQCTSEYKSNPIQKKQRALLGYEPKERIPIASAEVQIGITTDEARRATPSKVKWIDNLYPLIDPLKMSRIDCQKWWEDNYPHRRLMKSACIGCPYRNDKSWREMQLNDPDLFAEAVLFDTQIRKLNGIKGDCFVHRSGIPLGKVDLQQTQIAFDLEDDLYCAGGCGL